MNTMMMMMMMVGLVSCSHDKPAGDESGPEDVDTAAGLTPASPQSLKATLAFTDDLDIVDECATVCVSVIVSDEHEPAEGANVDIWLGNDCIGPDLQTDGTGLAQACVWGVPLGDTEVVAVVSHEDDHTEASAMLTGRPFGFVDGIERDTTPLEGLPFVPNFSRHSANPVLSPGHSPSPDAAGLMFPSVAKVDDTWVMWHARTPDLDYSIGVATSNDGVAWTKVAGESILPTGLDGSWRRYATNSPMFLQVGIDWRVYFTGRGGETGDLTIGMAAVDGAALTAPYPENPVFGWSDSELDWAGTAVAHPSIIHHPDGQLEMWYSTGYHRIGYAYSLDGIGWNRHCKNPVFEGEGAGWEAASVKSAEVVYAQGYYMMSYTGGPRGDFMLGWAMSRDGIHWTRSALPVLATPTTPGTWESNSVLGSALVVDGDTLKMYYSGTGVTGSAIGLATASLGELEPAP